MKNFSKATQMQFIKKMLFGTAQLMLILCVCCSDAASMDNSYGQYDKYGKYQDNQYKDNQYKDNYHQADIENQSLINTKAGKGIFAFLILIAGGLLVQHFFFNDEDDDTDEAAQKNHREPFYKDPYIMCPLIFVSVGCFVFRSKDKKIIGVMIGATTFATKNTIENIAHYIAKQIGNDNIGNVANYGISHVYDKAIYSYVLSDESEEAKKEILKYKKYSEIALQGLRASKSVKDFIYGIGEQLCYPVIDFAIEKI